MTVIEINIYYSFIIPYIGKYAKSFFEIKNCLNVTLNNNLVLEYISRLYLYFK